MVKDNCLSSTLKVIETQAIMRPLLKVQRTTQIKINSISRKIHNSHGYTRKTLNRRKTKEIKNEKERKSGAKEMKPALGLNNKFASKLKKSKIQESDFSISKSFVSLLEDIRENVFVSYYLSIQKI